MWEDGPAAPFSGYINKGDHNESIDQMAGQIFGTANTSYVETHRDEIVYLDKKTGLLIFRNLLGLLGQMNVETLGKLNDSFLKIDQRA